MKRGGWATLKLIFDCLISPSPPQAKGGCIPLLLLARCVAVATLFAACRRCAVSVKREKSGRGRGAEREGCKDEEVRMRGEKRGLKRTQKCRGSTKITSKQTTSLHQQKIASYQINLKAIWRNVMSLGHRRGQSISKQWNLCITTTFLGHHCSFFPLWPLCYSGPYTRDVPPPGSDDGAHGERRRTKTDISAAS